MQLTKIPLKTKVLIGIVVPTVILALLGVSISEIVQRVTFVVFVLMVFDFVIKRWA